MGRKKRKSKLVSSYFEDQSRRNSKKFSSKYNHYSYPSVGTTQIRKIAENVFGSEYGFKAGQNG